MVQALQVGSRGPEVIRLQKALNARPGVAAQLNPDGIFGIKTKMAVYALQNQCWLVEDGIAGQCTQNALYGGETYDAILHDIPLQAQPTDTMCWAASTAMMISSNPWNVRAATPAAMLTSDGSLRNWSETDQALERGREYAAIHRLRCNAPQSYMITALQSMLKRGPIMFDMLWNVASYLRKNPKVPGSFMGSAGHMICVIGIRGDDDQSGKGTTLRINDPWSPNEGETYSVNHFRFMQRVPAATYRVFERR